METIQLVVALAAQRGWSIYQLDVKFAFLHGELNEEIFIEQPCGYVQKGNEQKVYKLNKALYGLKQAPCAWYSRIEAYFMKEVFEKCDYEHTLFIKTNKEVLQKSDGIFISQKRYVLEVLNRFGMDKSNSISNPIVPSCKLVKDEGKGGDDELVACTDSDYAGDLEDRKSTSGSMVKKGVGKARSKSKQVMCYSM
ncbi:Retrovirus-related Pol polyprotein from transposon TNT 1-94 [Vitis vinifera]|uniref:Retrovirus-related Pol polyprotein from transposon TNT 1-94 n=1 Tax=Vitis vinifera TaxID=29760 RepID=A0A438ILP4_VITVI|nr:Retrovirus-related Pol polyprotein from transposon TNT 1-94 [Vitis vinifera]